MNVRRVLIVEDEPVTRMMIEARLRGAGHTAVSAPSAEEALQHLAAGPFAVMIVDLHLEEMNGVDLMAHARELDPNLELIIFTGTATLESAIAAANRHVFIYLRKPVRSGEIEEHVAAAIRRRRQRLEQAATLGQIKAALQVAEPPPPAYGARPAPRTYCVGAIAVEPLRHHVTVAGREVELTKGEYDLLLYFVQRPEVVHSPETIAREVLRYPCPTRDEAREPVKMNVCRLRKKIERDSTTAPTRLVSVRGAGYMLTAGD